MQPHWKRIVIWTFSSVPRSDHAQTDQVASDLMWRGYIQDQIQDRSRNNYFLFFLFSACENKDTHSVIRTEQIRSMTRFNQIQDKTRSDDDQPKFWDEIQDQITSSDPSFQIWSDHMGSMMRADQISDYIQIRSGQIISKTRCDQIQNQFRSKLSSDNI